MKAATVLLVVHAVGHILFQSTPPVKAATQDCPSGVGIARISIHAAREGGDPFDAFIITPKQISIHAAREGGDRGCRPSRKLDSISIHAAREGGDQKGKENPKHQGISIHAAREGGDGFGMSRLSICGHFNPRRP